MVEMMADIAPGVYSSYVIMEKDVKTLYVKLKNTLYGTLKSVLILYKKLRKDLENEGFVVNPYNICVSNKDLSGYQMTELWHVDDVKVSHINAKEVEE